MQERADNGAGEFGEAMGVDPKDGGHIKREEGFFSMCASKSAKMVSTTVMNGGKDVFVVYDMDVKFNEAGSKAMGGAPGFAKRQGTLLQWVDGRIVKETFFAVDSE